MTDQWDEELRLLTEQTRSDEQQASPLLPPPSTGRWLVPRAAVVWLLGAALLWLLLVTVVAASPAPVAVTAAIAVWTGVCMVRVVRSR